MNSSNGKAAMEHLLSAITILVLWLTTLGINHFTIGINRCFLVGNCLVGSLAVETAAIQTKPAGAGLKILIFLLVREGGLRLCRREFHSPGLILNMTNSKSYSLGHWIS